MTDYTELKRLAEAATPGPWSYDGSYVCPARVEEGTTYVETWRSVADCAQPENTKFIAATNPFSVLAMIAESDRLSQTVESLIQMERATGNRAIEYAGKCDDLKAEVAGLKTGYEAYERVNAELKAEVEKLRKDREGKVLCDLELFETLRDSANTEADEHRQCMATYRPLRQASLDSVVKKCDELLAALGQGEQS